MVKIILLQFLVFFASCLYASEKCYDTGKKIPVAGGILIPSPDSSKLLSFDWADSKFIVHDLVNGTKKTFDKPAGANVGFRSDNEVAFHMGVSTFPSNFKEFLPKLKDLETTLVDLESGKKKKVKGSFIDFYTGKVGSDPKIVGNNIVFSNNGKDVFRYHKMHEGPGEIAAHTTRVTGPDVIYIRRMVGSLVTLNSQDGKTIFQTSGANMFDDGIITSDEKTFVNRGYRDGQGLIQVVDLDTKKEQLIRAWCALTGASELS